MIRIEAGDRQKTLANPVRLSGKGLHSGRHADVEVLPAPAAHGLVFHLVTRDGRTTIIPASWRKTRPAPLCTCLSNGGTEEIRTVEHILAGFYAADIDNAVIIVRGGWEIPVLDGSARPWVEAFTKAGVLQMEQTRKIAVVTKPFVIRDGVRFVCAEPADMLSVSLDTHVKGVGRIFWCGGVEREFFTRAITPARTYGQLLDGLMAKIFTRFMRDPLCLGAGIRSAVVLMGRRVLNPDGLRFADEFARHRVLDFVGDLQLLGCEIRALLSCHSPTHQLTGKFLESFDARMPQTN